MSIDWDKPIETVSGKPAKVVSRDFKSKGRGFDVVVQIEEDYESRLCFYLQGGRPVYADPLLRNMTRKVTRWLNLYALAPGVVYFTDLYEAAQAGRDTNSTAHGKYLKTISVEMEVPCD
jgi:hypothetical protein